MTKTAPEFYKEVIEKFPFEPTNTQDSLIEKLAEFIFETNKEALFLIKGYAGTGKTTTISTVVNNLWRVGQKAVLLAPTGRAAKVISGYSNRQAFTIHKKIYRQKLITIFTPMPQAFPKSKKNDDPGVFPIYLTFCAIDN